MAVDLDYKARNQVELQRLRQFVERLSDADFQRKLDNEWTVGAALAHLAFWDRLILAQLERWERDGAVLTNSFDSELLNTAALPAWLALPPAAVRTEVVAAAEAADARVAALSQEMVEKIVAAGRPKAVERANHRRNHLEEIEAKLGSRG